MKKLGLGIQSLSELKSGGMIYVDKTEIILDLIREGKYYFLSRPRRFGKSLLIGILQDIFEGRKELFEGCRIYDKWNWEEKNPVIKIDFTNVEYRELGLKKALDRYLSREAERFGIRLKSDVYSGKFMELTRKLGAEKGAVILVDEYDKPVVDYLETSSLKQAVENREIMKTFYAGIKGLDEYIRFFMLTGVSKFSRMSMLGDLNHLRDISVTGSYAGLLGYTEEEIKENYGPYLESLAEEFKATEDEIMERIGYWYNGYSWDGKTFLYNPYSTLNLLASKEFKNFWFDAGPPAFLIKHIKESGAKINESLNKTVGESEFNSYDVDDFNSAAIMFQNGYLTIKEWDRLEDKYVLDFPNKEARESFLDYMAKNYADSSTEEMSHVVESLAEALQTNDVGSFFDALRAFFGSIIARQPKRFKDCEGFYHSIIFMTLKTLGVRMDCEVWPGFGVTNAVIEAKYYIYVMEFGMGAAEDAVERIKKKRYCAPYLEDWREVVMVGVGMNKAIGNLSDYVSWIVPDYADA